LTAARAALMRLERLLNIYFFLQTLPKNRENMKMRDKHAKHRWKSKTPVNLAIELNDIRDDEPTQQVHITDPDLFAEDCEAMRDGEPTTRRRIAHSFSGVIDEEPGL
jgi:hypothetical protein